jgi:Tfp pilus assembly protein PilN
VRPINLIPPEQRRGEHAPLRSGPLAYILVGALVAVLAGVTMLVLAGNQIKERKADIANLKVENAAEAARAQRLSAFVQFSAMREQRLATVASLADSRFDWERVMRELALVLPEDAWLIGLTATAAPGASSGGGGGSGSGLRTSAPGPALELSGCASGQQAVAGFVGALKDIDGVTRVGVESSELADEAGGGGGSGESDGEECRTRKFIAKFQIVVAFDAAPVPAVVGTGEVAAPPAEAAPSSGEESAGEESEGG